MNEAALRWKGRLGSLKALAALILLFAVIFLAISIEGLNIASSNPTQPQVVKIGQLASSQTGPNRYVTISGTALYPAAYEETTDGRTTAEFYFVVDEITSDMVLVKASKQLPATEQEEHVTLSGLTHTADAELKRLVESDLADIQKAGLSTTSELYLADAETPPSAGANTAAVVGLGILSVLCVATFFFPGTVFGVRPIDPAASPAATTGKADTWVTGRFQKLTSTQPAFVFGKGQRSFTNAVVNVIPLDNRQLMLYIHHVMTYRTYGVKVSERQSDWGALIDSANVVDIEPGKVYGWRDKWAVRFRYHTADLKQQSLIVTFNQPAAQTQFVGRLRQLGFAVGSGETPLLWSNA
jgi:hypothetical protein